MAKFDLGQRVKVVHGDGEPFCGRITEITPPKTYYRVEAQGKDGMSYAMTVEESWLEQDRELDGPSAIDRAECLISSLRSLAYSIGGTHIAGWVEEAERAADKGRALKYE